MLYYPCAVCARVMRSCPSMCVCVCVDKKHSCLRLTARNSPRKHSLQLLHWIYSPMKTFSVLASLARAANPWLSNATCPCNSMHFTLWVCHPTSYVDVLTQSHMHRTSELLEAYGYSISLSWGLLWCANQLLVHVCYHLFSGAVYGLAVTCVLQ